MSNIEPINEYDANGKLIHYRDSTGYEYWWEYDSNGNCVHYRDSTGYEYWREYDSNGKEIHYRDSDGYEYWWEYDANDKMIHYRNSNGDEYWYDANGNCVHYRNSDGYEVWYDSDGNLIDKPTEKKDNSTMSNIEPIQPNKMTKNEFMAHYGNCSVSLASVDATNVTMMGYVGESKDFMVILKFSVLYRMDAMENGIDVNIKYKVHQFDPDYMGVKYMETGRIVNEWSMHH